MTRVRSVLQCSILFLMSASLIGCLPSAQTNSDEQRDPHYLSGRARVTSLDYKGAVEEFEKAIEANPRSASAHLELGLLYEEHMQDYAAAIYHYEKHLKLRPSSEYTERARDRIRACKAELVKTEYLAPVAQGMQREMEKLMTENMLLKQRIETLEAQLKPVPANQPQVRAVQQVPVQNNFTSVEVPRPAPQPTQQEPSAAVAARSRTHTVKSGDKLTNIARQYGVDLAKLMKANPGVDPTRLQIGQKLNIPE